MKDMEIFFSDMTIADADGSCSVVCDIMNREIPKGDWMIESTVALSNGEFESAGIIQFWRNKEAILTQYESGFYDETVPVDIVYLHEYLQENGWNFVVNDDLVLNDGSMWDKFFAVVDEDDNYVEDRKDRVEDYDEQDEEDFLDYIQKSKEYKRPTANKYNILNTIGFGDHGYDMQKREKTESESKF